MFRGKKWLRYARKKTWEEILRMRVERAKKGWRTRKRMKKAQANKPV
jgi:hypothetical protein